MERGAVGLASESFFFSFQHTIQPGAVVVCADQRPHDQPKAGFQSFSFSILHGLYDGIVERALKTANQGEDDGVLVGKILIEGSNAYSGFRGDRVGVESTKAV